MEIWETTIIAFGLAMDCLAVSIGIGSSGYKKSLRTMLRLAFHFGLFQGLMAFLGWLAGSKIVIFISNFDHWVAFILLAWVGGRMIKESFSSNCGDQKNDPTRGHFLMILCIATSLDALAVGLSLAFVDVKILGAALIIGVVSLLFSIGGYVVGSSLGEKFGKRMEFLGGLILIGIGIKILASHIF